MGALSEVAVDIVASGDEARFRDLMEAHHYLGALPGNLGPKALQRFRVRRRDGQYRAPSLSANLRIVSETDMRRTECVNAHARVCEARDSVTTPPTRPRGAKGIDQNQFFRGIGRS